MQLELSCQQDGYNSTTSTKKGKYIFILCNLDQKVVSYVKCEIFHH